jgi:polar amino acid transport system substrate-binding protein
MNASISLWRQTALILLTFSVLSLVWGTARAGAVWERILRTGEIRLAADNDTAPFSYVEGGRPVKGFSIDIAESIRVAAERVAGRPLVFRPTFLEFEDRLEAIADGSADLDCSQYTPTWERHKRVDFSIPFMLSAYEIALDRNKLDGALKDFAGMRVALEGGWYMEDVLRRKWSRATFVITDSLHDSFVQLERGEVDAVFDSAVAIRAQMRQSPRRDALQVFSPQDRDMTEPIACMVPQNDSEWRRVVDQAIGGLLVGLEHQRGGYALIHARWFGHLGMVHFPLDLRAIQFLVDHARARGVLGPDTPANVAQNPVWAQR